MIHLIVDSTFGIEKEYAEKHNIEVVSLKLVLENKVTDEGYEPEWEEFYGRLKNSKEFPTTSQPSPQDFIDAINKINSKDPNAQIVILTISGYLSGTINSATLASKEFASQDILVLDSRQASACEKILAEEVVEQIESGMKFEQIKEFVEGLYKKLSVHFVPATMEYLKRGGRIGTLSATLASVLQIKPIFKFADGAISIAKKVLGYGRALQEAVELLPKNLKKLYICYIHDKTNVPLLIEKIKHILNLDNLKIVPVTPVFGAHVGIGAVGLAALQA